MKRLFAIVGYSCWGKSNTLDELFSKKHYTPLSRPITMIGYEQYKFVVIEASNEDRYTIAYLKRLGEVLDKHNSENVSYIITVSLIFKSKNHDVKPVFEYLKGLSGFDVQYMILNKGWNGDTLKEKDTNQLRQCVEDHRIHEYNEAINRSTDQFKKRTKRIQEKIISLL